MRVKMIVAYDGTYLADMAGMPLTVVRQDFQALTSSVADCMMRLIDGKAGDGSVDDGDDSGDAVSDVSSHGAFGIGEAEHLIPVSLIARYVSCETYRVKHYGLCRSPVTSL